MCLRVDASARIPNNIGSLKSLEELSWLHIGDTGYDNVEALGLLTKLRVLLVALFTFIWNDKLLESLHKLKKTQDLKIVTYPYNRHRVNMDHVDLSIA